MIFTKTITKAYRDLYINKIHKFEKRIKSAIEVSISDSYFVSVKNIETGIWYDVEKEEMTLNIPDIEYVIPGYKVIGVANYKAFDHNGSGLVTVFDDTYIDEVMKYQDEKNARCDHCKTVRPRNSIIVVHKEETNEFLVLGRNCLKYFLKVENDPENLFWLNTQVEQLDDDEFIKKRSMKFIDYTFKLDYILGVALYNISKFGYLSQTAFSRLCEEGNLNGNKTTTTRVFDYIFNSKTDEFGNIIPREDIDAKFFDEGIEMLEYLKTNIDTLFSGNTTYNENIKAIINSERVNYTLFGLLISTVKVWQKRFETKEDINEFYGSIKDKIQLELTLEFEKTLYNEIYGNNSISKLYSFKDSDGRVFKWFASKDCGLELGKNYTIKGTIKDHSVYNGQKQTMITRCKVI